MEPLRARAAKLLAAKRRERQQRFPTHRRPAAAALVSAPPALTPVAVGAGKTVVLGRDDRSVPLALDEESRLRHMQVIGTTGAGKSNLFFQMARQDIENGRGVLFVDPHGSHPGSGYRQLIAWLSEKRPGCKTCRPHHRPQCRHALHRFQPIGGAAGSPSERRCRSGTGVLPAALGRRRPRHQTDHSAAFAGRARRVGGAGADAGRSHQRAGPG